MIDILSSSGLEMLADCVRQRLVIAFDFDGTLAPIVDEPDAAQMRPGTRTLLRVLCGLYPCTIISGRRRADVAARVGAVPLVGIMGNHGAEPSASARSDAVRARVEAWVETLREAVNPEEITIEDKEFTLSLHYRRARNRELARDRLWTLAAALPGAKLVGGHAVVNVLPENAPHKGDAVEVFAASFAGRPVAFVGDDEVDEDAFRSRAVTLPIRVGHHPDSEAGWFLREQACIDALLQELIRVRLRLDGIADQWVGLLSSAGGSA